MRVRYAGPYDAVEVGRGVGHVAKGDTVDVDDATGRDLVGQGWREVKPAESKPAKKSHSKEGR